MSAASNQIADELKKKNCTCETVDVSEETYPEPTTPVIPDSADSKDNILLLDIIERVNAPERFMDNLRKKLKRNPATIIVTTPNIAFFINRLQLFMGRFNYSKLGILDMRNQRLFTFNTLKRMCEECGYIVRKMKGIPAPFPKALGNTATARFLLKTNRLLIKINPRLFSYQIYSELQPTPVVDNLLQQTITSSSEKANELTL
jgi:hypothetical protein